MERQITSRIINALWTAQRIVILGGMPCYDRPAPDEQGPTSRVNKRALRRPALGFGPAEGEYCVNGRMWYIMHIAPSKVGYQFWSSRRWGRTAAPPGMFELGRGPYEGITYRVLRDASFSQEYPLIQHAHDRRRLSSRVFRLLFDFSMGIEPLLTCCARIQDVITSSVNVWTAAGGNRYSANFANQRFLDEFGRDDFGNPGDRVTSESGSPVDWTFTIPVSFSPSSPFLHLSISSLSLSTIIVLHPSLRLLTVSPPPLTPSTPPGLLFSLFLLPSRPCSLLV